MKIKGCIFVVALLFFHVAARAQFLEQSSVPLSNVINPATGEQSNPEIDRVISIVNTVEEKNNFIDQLNPDSKITLNI